MKDNKRPTIIYKKNENGEYIYQELNKIDFSDSSNEMLEKGIIIPLDGDKFESIKANKSVELKLKQDDAEYIFVTFSDDLRDQMVDCCEEKNIPGAEKILENLTQVMAEKIDRLKLEKSNGNTNCNIVLKEIGKGEKKSNNDKEEKPIDMSTIKPKEVIAKIKKKVIGQDKAVETLVNNIYNNQLVIDGGNPDSIDSSKANILYDGPTGTGKTLIAKSIAKEMNIPLIKRSAKTFATAGYKGAYLTELLTGLLEETKGNLELAERGIVIIDEFDKLACKNENDLEMGKSVQEDLLSYLSGETFMVDYKGQKIEFDTSKITFICTGAFQDLNEQKINEGTDKDGTYTIEEKDYIEQGFIRELIGRFSLTTFTRSLDRNDFKRILEESELSPLKALKAHAENEYHKEIVYDKDTLEDLIIEEAIKKNTGARALNEVVLSIRNEILDELINSDKKTIEINENTLKQVKESAKRQVIK